MRTQQCHVFGWHQTKHMLSILPSFLSIPSYIFCFTVKILSLAENDDTFFHAKTRNSIAQLLPNYRHTCNEKKQTGASRHATPRHTMTRETLQRPNTVSVLVHEQLTPTYTNTILLKKDDRRIGENWCKKSQHDEIQTQIILASSLKFRGFGGGAK